MLACPTKASEPLIAAQRSTWAGVKEQDRIQGVSYPNPRVLEREQLLTTDYDLHRFVILGSFN